MTFTSPIWLIGLLPWAALTAWLLTGRREEARVPFVHLWPNAAAPLRARQRLHRPPVAVLCLLAALLLAVLAAAGPRLARDAMLSDVTLVVDLHVASPGRNLPSIDLQPERVLLVRGDVTEEIDPANWRQRLGRLSSTPTLPALRAAVADALKRDPRRVVVVISNQRLEGGSDRVVQIASSAPPQNVGIVRLAARQQPARQVMVTVRNQSQQTRAALTVSSDGASQREAIELPPAGGEKDYFVDMPAMGRVVAVALEAPDEIDADNRAWLVRSASWPHVEARGDVPAELVRVIDAYGKLRRADAGSKRVAVTGKPGDEPAAVIIAGGAEQTVAGPLQVLDHPVSANVEWNDALGPARVSEPPAGDWTPVVRAQDRTLVAVRDQPARQVWVGFESDIWPRHSSYVIFWTNVFDWLGHGGGESFAGEPVEQPGPGFHRLDDLSGATALPNVEPMPGIWGRGDGELRALNAIDIRLDPPAPTDWRARLAALKSSTSSGRANFAGPALVAALALALIASVTWASVKRGAVPA